GNWTNNGTFGGAGTSTVEFDGSSATITGGTFESLKINSTGSGTLGSNITTSGVLNVAAGTFTLNGFSMTVGSDLQGTSGATLKLGTSGVATVFPSFTNVALQSTSTVHYAANVAQTIATAPAYGELRIESSSSVTKTPDAGTTISATILNLVGSSLTFDVTGKSLSVNTIAGNGALSF